ITVFDFGDIGQALAGASSQQSPDLVLVDADLALRRNFSGLDRLVSACPGAAIVLLASECNPATARAALDSGARGYLPKAIGEEVLFQALAAAAGGRVLELPPELADAPACAPAPPFGSPLN